MADVEELAARARSCETKAREATQGKDYAGAIKAFKEAVEIYERLGWNPQAELLRKEIRRVKHLENLLGGAPGATAGPAAGSVGFGTEDRASQAKEERKSLEREAAALVEQAKAAAAGNRFDEAISLYRRAGAAFEKVGLSYQVKKVAWEIRKLENLRENAEKMATGAKAPESSIAEKRARRLCEEALARETATKTTASSRSPPTTPFVAHASVTPSTGPPTGPAPAPPTPAELAVGPSYEELKERKLREREERLRALWEKKEREERLQNEALELMDQGKKLVDAGDYDAAGEAYAKAAEIFKELDWKDQFDVLQREIRLLKVKQREKEERRRKEEEARRKQQEEFERQVKILEHKAKLEAQRRKEEEERRQRLLREKQEAEFRQREEQLRKQQEERRMREEERRRAQDPAYQAYLKKKKMAESNLEKAERLLSLGKVEKALARLEFVLDTYVELEFPQEKVEDLRRRIEQLRDQGGHPPK
ncbi:MAG: hypothetical protein Kow0069_27560 [Promethearchaeota archaeon]